MAKKIAFGAEAIWFAAQAILFAAEAILCRVAPVLFPPGGILSIMRRIFSMTASVGNVSSRMLFQTNSPASIVPASILLAYCIFCGAERPSSMADRHLFGADGY